MSRKARASIGNLCYHIINRGNGRMKVFHKPDDYQSFIEIMQQACQRLPMRVLGWCLMPNHFHLVLFPHADGDLSHWMQWLMTCHVRRYHRHYNSSGHIWQGRFKAFPIQHDKHLLTVLRYVERNPLRAKLVKQAKDWQWSSLYSMQNQQDASLLSVAPVQRPKDWLAMVNKEFDEDELTAIRNSVNRGAPFGNKEWVKNISIKLDLQSTINPRGRPTKDLK